VHVAIGENERAQPLRMIGGEDLRDGAAAVDPGDAVTSAC
jgi:hypothetical protein